MSLILWRSPDNGDAKGELKKLNASLLVNFVELLRLLVEAPSEAPAKIADIRLILINFHHLLNAYRAHQVGDCVA